MRKPVSLVVGMGFLCLGGTLVDADDVSKSRNSQVTTSQVQRTYPLTIVYQTTDGQVLAQTTETLQANQKVTKNARTFPGYTLASAGAQTVQLTQAKKITFVYSKQVNVTQIENQIETQALTQISRYRQSKGLNTIRPQATIQKASDQRAKELFTSFSHTRPNGRSGLATPSDYGYTGITYVENLGYMYFGQTLEWYQKNAATKIVNGWIASPEHNKNLLNRQPTEGAVGVSLKQVGPNKYDMTFSYLGGLQRSEYKK